MTDTAVELETVEPVESAQVRQPVPVSDEQLVAMLVERARSEGLQLTGEGGLLQQLTKRVLESALEGEITDHVGYDKHDAAGRNSGNSRNGTRAKTVLTDVGPVEVKVPRDTAGTFEPQIVKKRQRRLTGVDEMVLSLSAKGLTHGEISAHLAEVYGAEVSKQTITTITDKVMEGMAEWQARPLDRVYPVVFVDAINVKIRDGKVANRPIYVAMAVTVEGTRDILGRMRLHRRTVGCDLIRAGRHASSQLCPRCSVGAAPTRGPSGGQVPNSSGTSVTLGVDTHADVHVAAALDQLGRRLGTLAVPSTPAGYASLEAWATGLGTLEQVGLEGTGCYGAGLSRWLRQHGHRVVEVNRPDRQTRRRRGKSDVVDAEAAARAVQAGTATATPKSGDGAVEMIRALRVARRSAMKARTQAVNQLKALIVTAPDILREHIRGLHRTELVRTVTRWRPGAEPDTLTTVTKLAMQSIAHRYLQLDDEISELDRHLQRLVTRAAPELMAVKGLGAETVAALLVAVGDNPGRLRSESAFAHLCGVAPIPASSGKTSRHRLNRGGDRQANHALYMIAVSRMAWEPRTRAYVTRRTAEGKTKTEIIRCLKRHIAREVYGLLVPRTPVQPPSRQEMATAA